MVSSVSAFASGYGVFTQGASGLGQANAVVAHPTGPSSLYFNPALLNDVPGRQVEVGATAIYARRDIALDSGGSVKGDRDWQLPGSFYYTHNGGERLAAGLGVFFPFGLANDWGSSYEGRYIGTKGEMFSMNVNPAVSYKVNDRLSLAAGLDFIYLDTDLRTMINQPKLLEGLTSDNIEQTFAGDGWGHGYNLGLLYKATDRVALGAAYRSQVDVDLEGSLTYGGVDPLLSPLFRNGLAEAEIELPAQFVVGVATRVTDDLTVEIGARWEDWKSNDRLVLNLQHPSPRSGAPSLELELERRWRSTWTYNIGANYRLSERVALNCGYLYGENPVPTTTFEPIIPDADAHLFTVGTDLTFGQWVVSGALGYEYHESRRKTNGATVNDPLDPANTADGKYDTDIFLLGLSVGYKF